MRIAVLEDAIPPNSGGAGVIAYNLARGLQRKGHEVVIITTVRERTLAGVKHQDGLIVHSLVSNYPQRFQAYVSLWNIPVVREVEKILKDFKPEVVHAHNVHLHLSYRCLVIAKHLGARVVLTCHDVMSFNYQKLTDFIDPTDLSIPTSFNYRVSAWRQFKKNRFRYNPFRNYTIRRILRHNVDRIVAVSDALKQALEDNGIDNVQTIHNGIDVDEWEEPKEAIEAFKQKYSLGERVILFGGQLTKVKGAVKIIDALAAINKILPDAQLLVVGGKGAYDEQMQQRARELGVADNIVFTGWLSGHELHTAYHAATLVAVPSLCFDSFPTMNLEGMACHKPVIATCFGGSREAVIDGVSGYIVNPYDVATLSARALELLQDTGKAAHFGDAGYAAVKGEFSLTHQVEEYEKVFGATV